MLESARMTCATDFPKPEPVAELSSNLYAVRNQLQLLNTKAENLTKRLVRKNSQLLYGPVNEKGSNPPAQEASIRLTPPLISEVNEALMELFHTFDSLEAVVSETETI